jgi:hypothetical protein
LSWPPSPHRLKQPVFEDLHALVEEVFLGWEVIEDRGLGDVGLPRHLGHSHRLEAALGKEAQRRLPDHLARLLFLALAQSCLSRHRFSLSESLVFH